MYSGILCGARYQKRNASKNMMGMRVWTFLYRIQEMTCSWKYEKSGWLDPLVHQNLQLLMVYLTTSDSTGGNLKHSCNKQQGRKGWPLRECPNQACPSWMATSLLLVQDKSLSLLKAVTHVHCTRFSPAFGMLLCFWRLSCIWTPSCLVLLINN